MDTLKSRVGQKIKTFRKEKNLTQEELAEKAGISIDFLSLIERGKNAPSLESLEKLSKALNINISDLFL